MPFPSTDIIDDDNIFFFTILELNLDQFTYFGNNNVLSGSIPSILDITFS